MSESERSSPVNSDSEADGAEVRFHIEEDGEISSPPQTAELTEETQTPPYTYLTEDLSLQDQKWIENNIKMNKSVDETDEAETSGGGARSIFRLMSSPGAQSANLVPTNAFGKLFFGGEDASGALPSWFVRLTESTSKDTIQELLENKLKVMSSASLPIRIHCIDFSSWPDMEKLQFSSKHQNSTKDNMDDISSKLQKDLKSMCKKTAGILLTWSGLKATSVMHKVLGGIMEQEQHLTNLATIATPPWNALNDDIRQQLQVKGRDVFLINSESPSPISPDGEGASGSSLPKPRAALGLEISQFASHFLLLDDENATGNQALASKKEKANMRHFHCKMISAMEEVDRRMPVVCILISGHHDALKMVDFALGKKIPVLIIKGSGGYADIIADVYLNAELETIKVRDEDGQVRTRQTRKAGKLGQDYLKDFKKKHPYLEKIFNKLDFLTVYIPDQTVQTLDSVIFEALLKNKQETKFGELVKVMKRSKTQSSASSDRSGFIDSDELQMDFFIEALKQNSVDLVEMFLNELDISEKFMEHFHMGRILRLYSQNTGQSERLLDFRKTFVDYLQKLTVLPLRCECHGCPSCDVTTNTHSKESELEVQRTCLHPIQELFLWSLHDQRVELAIVFWKRCEDKIASALVARRVFKTMAKEQSDPDAKWQLNQNVKQFQDLAIQTLRNCHSMDEIATELLLTKPCPWWGNLSVLQLAIMSSNREFMTQTACRNIMTRIWHGQPFSGSDSANKRPCQLVDIPPEECCRFGKEGSCWGCCPRIRWCSPFCQYITNFVMQICFLLLFSLSLLFDMGQPASDIICYILIVWVAAITVEEFRQLLSKPAVLRDNSSQTFSITRTKCNTYCMSYIDQGWNWIDAATILFFWIGMVGLSEDPIARIFGRILWSIDIFFFFMRTFQMLMVFEQLGLMLVMVYKMVKDTINFMIILLTFVLAYAVMSESVLYPISHFSWFRLLLLPRKAYWQVFGEFSLEEIEIREDSSCSANQSQHFGYDELHCPTKVGSYLVPVLLGIYVMITNVLLLNLLIARFGVTFNKVHDEACEHQSWHRCQIITEFYNHFFFPPPFSILCNILKILTICFRKVGVCMCQTCHCMPCCCTQQQDHHNTLEMRPPSGNMENAKDNISMTSLGGPDERRPLIPIDGLTATRSADRRSVDIKWTSDLPVKATSDQLRGQRVYTIKNTNPNSNVIDVYRVARNDEEGERQAFTVWNLEPSVEYQISVEDKELLLEPSKSSHKPEDLLEMLNFEEEQAKWVCNQQDASNSMLNCLQEQTRKLQEELGKSATETKKSHDGLKDVISKSDEKMSKYIKRMDKQAKENKDVFSKINENFNKLNEYVHTSCNERVKKHKEAKLKARVDQKEAEEQKNRAEEVLKETKAQLAQLHTEIRNLTTALQEERLRSQQKEELQSSLQSWKAELVRSLQQELQAQMLQVMARQPASTEPAGGQEEGSGH